MAIYITHCKPNTYRVGGVIMSYGITSPLHPTQAGVIALGGAPSRTRIPPYNGFVGVKRGDNPLNIPLKFLGKK